MGCNTCNSEARIRLTVPSESEYVFIAHNLANVRCLLYKHTGRCTLVCVCVCVHVETWSFSNERNDFDEIVRTIFIFLEIENRRVENEGLRESG